MSRSPFPSKQQIAEFVRESKGRVGKREIARAFRLDTDQKRELKRVLKEMKDEGTLARERGKSLSDPNHLPNVTVIEITGVDLDGDVLARPVKWDGDGAPPIIYVKPDRTGGPAPGTGERALARLTEAQGAYEAQIIRRIAAAPNDILGIVCTVDGAMRIRPVDKKQRTEYEIETEADTPVKPGDLVRAEPLRGSRLGLKRARVRERIADAEGPQSVSLISVHQHGIPVAFPAGALKQASAAREAPLDKRDDLRSVPLVTIDGADARDFDDAVFAEPDDDPENPDGYKLIVAIADVAWYVRPGDALDKAAFERGNSVYFPDRVVPMLPEELSNGWCSLRPKEDRPCLVAHLRIDSSGRLLSKRFKRAMMRSAARLTYEQVQSARDGQPDEQCDPLMESVITPLFGAFEILDAARKARGALDLDVPERRVLLNENGEMEGVVERERFDSHRLIEEFMVLANVAAAEFLEEKKRPCMYRVHDQPSMSKIEALGEFLSSIQISFDKGQTLSPDRFNRILSRVRGTPTERMVNDVILRSQAQATYDPSNIGHFGLGLRRYCHFTSPIRRYSDLLVHRALIRGMRPSAGSLPEDPGDFAKIGEHLSMTERRAQAAERDALDRYAAHFMSDRVGAEFDARINGVSRFGLFVSIDQVGADGLVPIRALPDDYYVHDEARHTLTGRRHGISYRLGDQITVTLREATPINGGLLFDVAGSEPASTSTQKQRTARSSHKPKKAKGKSKASRRKQRRTVQSAASGSGTPKRRRPR